jgi:hypothetical protein
MLYNLFHWFPICIKKANISTTYFENLYNIKF